MKTKLDREQLIEDMANYILENRLSGVSLRPLAEAAGTSDRMLIYHFKNKDALLHEVVGHIAKNYTFILNKFVSFEDNNILTTLDDIHAFMRGDDFQPYSRFWIDLVSEAQNGSEICYRSGRMILELLYRRTMSVLPYSPARRERVASFILASVFGLQVLEIFGRKNLADRALLTIKEAIKL